MHKHQTKLAVLCPKSCVFAGIPRLKLKRMQALQLELGCAGRARLYGHEKLKIQFPCPGLESDMCLL